MGWRVVHSNHQLDSGASTVSNKRKKEDTRRANNLVAKHARMFNLAHTFEDRKQAQKRGKVKHKGKWS
jgi:hypothetical protein